MKGGRGGRRYEKRVKRGVEWREERRVERKSKNMRKR